MRRLKQLQEVTGNEETALGKIDLDKDFDPDEHDKELGALVGDDYDDREEELAEDELIKAPSGFEGDLDTAQMIKPAKMRKGSAPSSSSTAAGSADVEGAAVDGEEPIDDDEEDENVDDETWWLCDMCQKGIPANKRRFDCSICENFTLCIKCFRVRRHPHKFIRRRVPAIAMPPEDLKHLPAAPAEQEAIDEYFHLDYEDIIGGDLPTRFKYRPVEGKDYGMSASDILNKSDQELNKIMPLKKLRTYRGTGSADDGDTGFRPRPGGRGDGGKGSGRGRCGRGGGGRGDGGRKRHKETSIGGDLSDQRLSAYNLQADRGGDKSAWKRDQV